MAASRRLTPRRRGRSKPITASDTTKPDPAPDDDKRSRENLLAEVNQLWMELAYVKNLQALVQARQKLRSGLAIPDAGLPAPTTGNCHDTQSMMSFFAVLKSAFFYLNKFDCVDGLRDGLAGYIHYYNHDRIMLKLKGLSPVQYRTQPWAA
jgi:putative transposase